MTLRPSNISARYLTVGALAVSAAVAACTIIAVQAFAQNRPSKRVSDKTPSVIVDLGVLEELGRGASAPEPAAKPPIAAPILRAPPKRPGAPAPLFLPPRSADERMAHKGSTTAKPKSPAETADAKRQTGDTKAKKNTHVAAAAPKKTVAAKSDGAVTAAKSKPAGTQTAETAKPAPVKMAVAPQKPAKAEKPVARKPEKTAVAAPAKDAQSAISKETAHKAAAQTAAKPPVAKAKEAKAPVAQPKAPLAKPKLIEVAKAKTAETEVVATVEKTPASAPREPPTSRIAALIEAPPAMPNLPPAAPIKAKPSADITTGKNAPHPAAAWKAEQAMVSKPRKPAEPIPAATSRIAKAAGGKSESAKPVQIDPEIEGAKIAKPTNWMASLVSKPPKSTSVPAAKTVKPAADTPSMSASKSANSAPQPIKVARALPETKAKPKPASTAEFSLDDPVALAFAGDATDLDADATRKVKALAEYLKGDERLRLKLLAYADGANRSQREIRQLSLFRALSVRAQLIKRGVSSARIEVRPRGDDTAQTPRDRVDLVVSSR